MYTGGAARKYPNTGYQRTPKMPQTTTREEHMYPSYTPDRTPNKIRSDGKETHYGKGPGRPSTKSKIAYDQIDFEEQKAMMRGKPSLDTYSARIVENDSKNYYKHHRINEFDEIYFNMSVRLSDVEIECSEITKIPFNVFNGVGNSKKDYLSTMSKIYIGSLTIPEELTSEFDASAIYVEFSPIDNTTLSRKYQFKLVPDSGSNVVPGRLVYKPDFDCFKPYTWIKFTEGTITLHDGCGPITFNNPCKTGIYDGMLLVTEQDLEVGDILCVKCGNGIRVTVDEIGDGFVMINKTIPVGEVEFVVMKQDFDLSIRAVGIVQDNKILGVKK